MSPRNEFQARDHEGEPGEDTEDLNQEESPPVEESPDRLDALAYSYKSLADLRKGGGLTTTEAHIAELKKKWNDPDHIFEI